MGPLEKVMFPVPWPRYVVIDFIVTTLLKHVDSEKTKKVIFLILRKTIFPIKLIKFQILAVGISFYKVTKYLLLNEYIKTFIFYNSE